MRPRDRSMGPKGVFCECLASQTAHYRLHGEVEPRACVPSPKLTTTTREDGQNENRVHDDGARLLLGNNLGTVRCENYAKPGIFVQEERRQINNIHNLGYLDTVRSSVRCRSRPPLFQTVTNTLQRSNLSLSRNLVRLSVVQHLHVLEERG